MHNTFESVTAALDEFVAPHEVFLCTVYGESSDFLRINQARARQAGHVNDWGASVNLIGGKRHVTGHVSLSCSDAEDRSRIESLVTRLRAQYSAVPEDPYLIYATDTLSNNSEHPAQLPARDAVLSLIAREAHDIDLAGIWASGDMYSGFANSFGQRNWHERSSFNFDWSAYGREQSAVKGAYAGFAWDESALTAQLHDARNALETLGTPEKKLSPGRYKVYLAPQALAELLGMLAWGGFSTRAHQTRQTPLLRMLTDDASFSPSVSLRERNDLGLGPAFTAAGFVKPDEVTLIENGRLVDCLTSPRSAAEFGATVNAQSEAPSSLYMDVGDIPTASTLAHLDPGILISNLWYCNYSDQNTARITGMTRFACFWVEDGEIRAPIPAMRFDESAWRFLGDKLIGLTDTRSLIIDPETYGRRSHASMCLPGALIDDFELTL